MCMQHLHGQRRSLITLSAAALTLALLGAGCTNPFKKDSAAVLKTATDQWVAADSVRMDATLALDFAIADPGKETQRGNINLRIAGAGAGKTVTDQRGDVTLTLRADTPFGDGALTLDERVVGQVIYLRLQDVSFTAKGSDAPPQATIDAMLGAAKGVIGGKWVKLDPQEIASLAQGLGGANVKLPTPEEMQSLQDAAKEALRANPILAFRQDLGKQKVGNLKAYHYRVGINRASIGALINQLAPRYGVQESDLTEITRALEDEQVRSLIDGVAGEVWISKKTNDIVKVSLPIDLTQLTKEEGTVTGNFTVALSDWGKPVTVEAPSDSQSIQELLGPLLGGFLGGGLGGGLGGSLAPEPSPGILDGTDAPAGAFDLPLDVGGPPGGLDPTFDGDGDGLSDMEEVQKYGSDPLKSDTDGDGFNDGDEVEKGYSPTGPGKLTE